MSSLETGEQFGAMQTIRLGIKHSPELVEGVRFTLLLAVLASVGQVVVPAVLGIVAAHTGVAAVFWASGVLLGGATEGARRSLAKVSP